ncbi:hypothetical protein LA59_10580 [Vibrio harveyi]|uniref:hypothetical protein n=1 Tax=Vibrio harveyi TaxID=669 RepID=UPI0005395BDA|nr:hypothetical protein [Vibrio harveyi]AIV05892.1 hypothetical protein LA59_10580 [Vibrio harveyi]
MVAVHWRLAQSNMGLTGFEALDFYINTQKEVIFDPSWRIGKAMRALVKHAYIYCKASNRIYSVPISVDLDTSAVFFEQSLGQVLTHENIEYGFRHSDGQAFFGDGGMAMHHKFYTDLSLTQRFNK